MRLPTGFRESVRRRAAGCLALLLASMPGASHAESDLLPNEPAFTGSIDSAARESDLQAAGNAGGEGDNAAQYCTNIADPAADARFARQAAALSDMEAEVNQRIDALEAKRAEYEAWLKKREDFLRNADASVVAIFTQMRPDAASAQLAVMQMESAAAILVKLNPRIASAILAEMDPTRAAQLTTTMTGMARTADSGGAG
jgi:flagellar motility protein MotE (MotC chaperone)